MTSLERQQQQQESLDRARQGQSFANYPAIIECFMARGIPASEIQPRVNVFGYNAWKALGRQVRRGEHGVKVVTFIEARDKDDEAKGFRMPRSVPVFHISQTDPIVS